MMNRRDNDDNIIEVPYYQTERNPNAPVNTPKKRARGTFILTLLLCAALFFTGGGIFGVYLAGQQTADPEASVRMEQNAEPSGSRDLSAAEDTPEASPSQAQEEQSNTSDNSGGAVAASAVNPDGRELSLTELFAGANPAAVAISTETTGRNVFGQTVTTPAAGSGFIISEDGYIVTNNHVIEDADSITVIMYDGTQYTATLVGSDSLTDIAVLKVSAKNLSYLTFGDSDNVQVGEQVAAIGNPLGEFANSFTVGYISAVSRNINIDGVEREMLQTDTAVNSGNSGGPLLNTKGRVIGVVSAKSSGSDVEGLGFAIPSNTVAEVAAQLIEKGYVSGRAAIGASLSTRSNYRQSCIYVESVESGRSADKAGLKAGDYILSADGQTLYSVTELRAILAVKSPGEKLTLEIQRGNSVQTLTLTLDEYKPASISNKSASGESASAQSPFYPDSASVAAV